SSLGSILRKYRYLSLVYFIGDPAISLGMKCLLWAGDYAFQAVKCWLVHWLLIGDRQTYFDKRF
ncbi:MAG: hypothetical protein AAF974_13215, partial [Cyanobacteria bacterium P01_E01_bin.34]